MKTTSKLAFTATAAGTLVPAAGAAIIYTDFSGEPISIVDPTTAIYIDFDTGHAGLLGYGESPPSDADAGFGFLVGNTEKPVAQSSAFNSTSSWQISVDDSETSLGVLKLSAGVSIPLNPSYFSGLSYYGEGNWASPNDGEGYVGFFNTDTNAQAWALINYNAGDDTISLLGIAYNPDGAILTGQTAIPEPASGAALAALLAGGTAAFRRRRRTA
jgi:hypothetical protein